MCRLFWSRAKSHAVLGGTLGENAAWCSCHSSSAQADGCGLSPAAGPALHVVLCGHQSVFSSPPGEANVSTPRIFPGTLLQSTSSNHAWRVARSFSVTPAIPFGINSRRCFVPLLPGPPSRVSNGAELPPIVGSCVKHRHCLPWGS
jgi:hypothetical protein